MIDLDLAPAIDGRHLQRAAGLVPHHLPGHDVRVMLEPGDQDLVPRSEARARVRLRHQVDALRGAANEDDFATRMCIDEPAHPLACTLIRFRGSLAKGIYAAV